MGVIDFLHYIMLSRLLSADLSLTFACPRNRLSNSRTQHSPTLSCCTSAFSFDNLQGLTYLQIKGSGLANTCPVLEGTSNVRLVPTGDYSFDKFCLEQSSFKVKDETQFKDGRTEFVDTKLMTCLKYFLDDMRGKVKVNGDGKICLERRKKVE